MSDTSECRRFVRYHFVVMSFALFSPTLVVDELFLLNLIAYKCGNFVSVIILSIRDQKKYRDLN